MTLPPNPIFRFQGETYAVKVENVAQTVARHEVVKLFTTLIGEMSACKEYQDAQKGRVFEFAFPGADAFKKALCMSGYTLAGVPLIVSPSSTQEPRRSNKHGRGNDSRRNLYVLGLPFELNKPEFIQVFSRFGTVTHAVILATVDNASRRRGFVVMSTHQEAKAAMDGLSRTELKGHTIDVSWAVVQRSQGFLDGGDRAMVLSQQNSPVASSPTGDFEALDPTATPETPAIVTPPMDCTLQTFCSRSAPSLLVTNLPAVLFAQPSDLRPLLCPFGTIVKLNVLDRPTDVDSLSVTVEYQSVSEAQEAKDCLNGQLYADRHIKAEFLLPDPPSPVNSEFSTWSAAGSDAKSGLNPYAAPFQVQSASSGSLAPFRYQVQDCYGSDDDFSAARRWSGQSTPFLGLPSSQSHAYANSGLLMPSLATFRPHSAPSHSGKGSLSLRPGNWTSLPQDGSNPSVAAFSPFST